jgi:hypothetical protein
MEEYGFSREVVLYFLRSENPRSQFPIPNSQIETFSILILKFQALLLTKEEYGLSREVVLYFPWPQIPNPNSES